jgi:steroid delta-isomerase-like uncharacterized protein
MSDSAQKQLVRTWYEVMWNRWDHAVMPGILDPEIEFRGSLGQVHKGYEGVRNYLRFVREAFPDFLNHIEEMVEEGNKVFAKLRYTGTHSGPLFGLPRSGRKIEYAGAALFSFRGGRIVHVWVLGDVDGLKRQLAQG